MFLFSQCLVSDFVLLKLFSQMDIKKVHRQLNQHRTQGLYGVLILPSSQSYGVARTNQRLFVVPLYLGVQPLQKRLSFQSKALDYVLFHHGDRREFVEI